MPRPAQALLEDLMRVVHADAGRGTSHAGQVASARALVPKLPYVHRTGKPPAAFSPQGTAPMTEDPQPAHPLSPLTTLARAGRLTAGPACTVLERDAGYERAVYASFGAGVYPRGHIALLLDARAVEGLAGTFTPFDSGGLAGGKMTSNLGTPLDVPAAFRDNLGNLGEVGAYAPDYLAAHLTNVGDYVDSRSDPDFPAVHHVQSREEPRLGWSIEAQIHEDVALPGVVHRVLLARKVAFDDIDDGHAWKGLCDWPSDTQGDRDEHSFFPFIAQMIQELVGEAP